MERGRLEMITLFTDHAFTSNAELRLDKDSAHHARARRARAGDGVRLLDGRGRIGVASIASINASELIVHVESVSSAAPPTPLEAIVPVADRDRMLVAAEKCVELSVTAWRPVYFARSRSVSPRGEGARFHEKVAARMRSALEQSGSAWLPEIKDETEAADAWESVPVEYRRVVLERDGIPLAAQVHSGPMAFAVGPEGGFERSEVAAASGSGWISASLTSSTLRFETAVMAAAAVIRATQLTLGGD